MTSWLHIINRAEDINLLNEELEEKNLLSPIKLNMKLYEAYLLFQWHNIYCYVKRNKYI